MSMKGAHDTMWWSILVRPLRQPDRARTSNGTHKTMVCLSLLALNLASCLATVHSSLTHTDAVLFVEQQHRTNFLKHSNLSCDHFVYKQTEEYVREQFSHVQEAVHRTAAILSQLNENISPGGGPWVLPTFLEPSVTDLVQRYGHVTRATISLTTPVGQTSDTDVVLFIQVERINGTLSVFRNWNQECTVNNTSERLANDVKVTSSVHCTSDVMETVPVKDGREGSAGNWSQLEWYKDGIWRISCLQDGRFSSTVTSADFILGIGDNNVVMDRSNTSRSLGLTGIMSVTVDLSQDVINQCKIDPASSMAALRHKCRPSTRCIHIASGGFTLGSYTCICDSPPSHHWNQSGGHFPGRQVEEEYYKHKIGRSNDYEASFDCLPCSMACDWLSCLHKSHCHLTEDLKYRLPVLGVTLLTILGVLVLLVLTFKYRHDKMMRASSPGLLYITLVGSLLLYSEVLIATFGVTRLSCMLRPWVRHIGFTLAYGGLLLKTWRISIIMRVFKSRIFRTRDSELYRKVIILTSVWVVFLLLWTVLDPATPLTSRNHKQDECRLTAWNAVAVAGEVGMLMWGGFLCHQARNAPHLYNETTQISYALWNEAIWEIVLVLARLLLYHRPDGNLLLLIYFIRTQSTVTAMLLLLYTPKFIMMFRKIRQVHGTLTDVYGTRRVHRLSLMVNKHGDIKTIYCTPCGPLAYLDHTDNSEQSSHDSNHRNDKEDEYSKAEVDALIELVSRLKSERELYKMQVKRLVQVLRNCKRKVNGLCPSLVVEEEVSGDRGTEYAGTEEDDYRDLAPDRAGGDGGVEEEEAARYFHGMAAAGPRTSRASTVTTFVSSSTPDGSSSTTAAMTDLITGFPAPPTPDPSLHDPVPHPSAGTNSPSPPFRNCKPGSNGISRYALTVLTRQLAHNHVLGKDLSPDTDDFPRLLHSHEETCNNNKLALRDFIPTVYGEFCDSLLGDQARELEEMGAAAAPLTRSSTDPARLLDRRSNSAEKLNFIMYI